MARTVRDARIDSRSARLMLKPKTEPYWRSLGPGTHLGYYRTGSGHAGTWIARFRPNGKKTGGYQKKRIATADDIRDADGIEVLSFAQAQEKARNWFTEATRHAENVDEISLGPYSVRDACADYLGWFATHKKSLRETKRMIEQTILPPLGSIDAKYLSTQKIRTWHEPQKSS